MKLSEFTVGNFGALRRANGTFAPRLTLVWGENESGKTTLFDFIRRTLFLRKIPKDDPYQPLHASRIFGTLFVHMDDGRALKVTLNGRKNLVEDSGPPATAMKEDFPPLKGETFDRIFTIGPDSLGKETQDRFFSAEAGLGFASLPEFMARADRQEKEIYVPAGSSEAPLNKIWDEMERNELEIEELKVRNTACWGLWNDLKKNRALHAQALDELKKDRQRLVRLETITQARPVWLEIRELENALSSSSRRGMPKDGMVRLDAFLEKVAYLRGRLDELNQKNERERLRRKMWETNPILSLLAYREVLESLEGETELFKRSEAEISLLEAETRDKEETLKRELADYVPHWSETDLMEADLSLTMDQCAKSFQEKFDELDEQKGVLTRKAEAEEARLDTLRAQAASIRDELENSEPVSINLQQARELLLDVRNGLLRSDALYWEIRGEKMCADVLEEELKAEGDPPARMGSYMAKLLLALLLLLSGIFVALGHLEPRVRPYDWYGLIFCALAAIFPLFSVFMTGREHKIRMEQWRLRYSRRNNNINLIDRQILAQRQEMQAIASAMEQKARILGIQAPPTMDDLDAVTEMLEDERHQMRLMEDRKNEEKSLLRDMEESVDRRNRLAEDLANLEQKTEDVRAEWRAWLAQNRFDPALELEYFNSFLAGIRAVRKDLQLLNDLRGKLRRHEEYTAAVASRILTLGDAIGLSLDGENLVAVFRSLKEALELKGRIEASLETERLLGLECSDLERDLNAAVGDVRLLCEEAGVDGEAAFRVLSEEREQRDASETRLEELRRTLAGFLGADAGEEAETPRESEFLADALAQAEEIEELRIAVAEGETTITALNADCEALEKRLNPASDDRLFALRQKNEFLRLQGEKLFKRWLTAALSKYFVEKAVESHKKERQPEIEKHLRQISSLMGASNADQDYLSLRLAMASYWNERARNERSESLPVLLDDVLSRFDEARQYKIMEALWRISEKNQIVLFACHRFTAEMFRSRLGDQEGFALIEMPAGGAEALVPRAKKSKR